MPAWMIQRNPRAAEWIHCLPVVVLVQIALAATERPVGFVVGTAATRWDDVFNFKRKIEDGLRGAAVFTLVKAPPGGPTASAALERKSRHRTAADLERKAEPVAPAAGASASEVLKGRLASPAGKEKYKLRRQTVEPVCGIIKSAPGFRRFMLRGLEKAAWEWTLACAACNLKRRHRLKAGLNRVAAG